MWKNKNSNFVGAGVLGDQMGNSGSPHSPTSTCTKIGLCPSREMRSCCTIPPTRSHNQGSMATVFITCFRNTQQHSTMTMLLLSRYLSIHIGKSKRLQKYSFTMIGIVDMWGKSVQWGQQIIWSRIWAIRQCYQTIKFHAGHSVLQGSNLYLRWSYLQQNMIIQYSH